MADANKPPIGLFLQATLWTDCEDNKGRKYSQLSIEDTPRILWELIPLKEKDYIPPRRVFIKDITFIFKRRRYVLQFERTKEAGEP